MKYQNPYMDIVENDEISVIRTSPMGEGDEGGDIDDWEDLVGGN